MEPGGVCQFVLPPAAAEKDIWLQWRVPSPAWLLFLIRVWLCLLHDSSTESELRASTKCAFTRFLDHIYGDQQATAGARVNWENPSGK